MKKSTPVLNYYKGILFFLSVCNLWDGIATYYLVVLKQVAREVNPIVIFLVSSIGWKGFLVFKLLGSIILVLVGRHYPQRKSPSFSVMLGIAVLLYSFMCIKQLICCILY